MNQTTEVIDLQSVKIEKKISALIADEKRNQIEEISFLISVYRERISKILVENKIQQTEYYELPIKERKLYSLLHSQIFFLECTINKIIESVKIIRGKS